MSNNIGSQADPAVTSPTSDATVTAALKGLLSLLAGDLSTAPFAAIKEAGLTELIGKDEQVDQNDYGGSVAVALGATMSGEILGVQFVSTEEGSGAVLTPAGTLLIFDANPEISAGDTNIGTGNWAKLIGMIEVAAADWLSDSVGAGVYYATTPVAFHAVSTLYLAWFHSDATSYNDASGDDEKLHVNLWIRRDS